MSKWKFSFPINGLHDVIKSKDSTIKIDDVTFHYRGDIERVGTVITEASTVEAAEKDSSYLINKSLGKICFAFNTEASISLEGFYYVDLTNDPNLGKRTKSLGMRYSFVREDPNSILAKMNSIDPNRKDKLDLALAYYKLGEYKNPLRIESFFSSITVLVRELWKNELTKRDKVSTQLLKEKIKFVLLDRNKSIFDEATFDKQWRECYADERCSIAHGRGSKLVDPRTIHEYDEIVNVVDYWTREVIYYYIDK